MPSYTLSGRVALVTGAQRGIGLETARALQARGAQVVLADLDADGVDRGRRVARRRARSAWAPTSPTARGWTPSSPRSSSASAGSTSSSPTPASRPTPATAPRDGRRRCSSASSRSTCSASGARSEPALPHVVARGGHVVVVASIYAFTNGMGNAPYAMAKAGVEQLGRALRAELSPHGASATTAYFGFIDTAMVHEALDRNPLARADDGGDPASRCASACRRARRARGSRARSRSARPRVILPKRWTALSVAARHPQPADRRARRTSDATCRTWCARWMPDQLRPLFDRVVIKELEPDRVRQSGPARPARLARAAAAPRHRARRRARAWTGGSRSASRCRSCAGDHVVFPASARARGWTSRRSGCSSAA